MAIVTDHFPQVRLLEYTSIRGEICSGDILLASGSAIFSDLIKHASNSIWSHVGFILRLDSIDRIMLLESVESIGVRTVPLSSYVNDYNGTGNGYTGRLLIARHKNFDISKIINLSQKAVDLFGYPYSKEDIVKIATRISMNALGLNKDHPLITANKAYICSEYVYECYKSVDIEVKYDENGYIAPVDFAKDSNINAICELQISSGAH
jgi:uncharacterized protein YycO